MEMKTVHRGRTKEGKKQLIIHLNPKEYDVLCKIADRELRSASAQAVWILRRECQQLLADE